MSSKTVKTKCPLCEKKYNVPASSVGHRARCSACNGVFRVAQRSTGHPSEDDILRWLSEATEETERHDPHQDDNSKYDNEHPEPPEQNDFQTAMDMPLTSTQIRLRKTG